MSTVDRLLERLEGVKRKGDNWVARCPAHEDREASLSISEGDDGRALVYCHAGCKTQDIVAKAGLTMSDLMGENLPSSNGGQRQIVATYSYVDESGTELYQTVRYVPKDFRPRRSDGDGGWIHSMGDARRVLFHLPQLLAGVKAGKTIYLCEGEKDVLAVEKAGACATTKAFGAKSPWLPEYSECLRGARVIVVAHKDAPNEKGVRPGLEVAEREAAALQGIAASVQIVQTPVEKAGADAADHLAAGLTLEELVPVDRAAETAGEVPVYSGLDLATMKILEPEPLIEGIAYVGCSTLLMGKLKGGGKTTASLDMCRQRIAGEPWCGRLVRRGPVLYLTEQSPQSFNPQCARAGLIGLGDFHVIYHRDVSVAGLEWPAVGGLVRQACTTTGADLVFIDNFSLWVGFVGDDESSSGPGNESMAVVERLLAAGLSVVAIQHTRKEGGSIYDAARGSTAIAGRFDELAWIKGSPFPRRRSLQRVGRVFAEDPPDLVLELDQDHRYQLVGNAPDLQDEDAEGVILEFLPLGREGAKSEDEVIGACKAASVGRDAASRTLRRLCEEETVDRSRGVIPGYKGYGYWRRHDLFREAEP